MVGEEGELHIRFHIAVYNNNTQDKKYEHKYYVFCLILLNWEITLNLIKINCVKVFDVYMYIHVEHINSSFKILMEGKDM